MTMALPQVKNLHVSMTLPEEKNPCSFKQFLPVTPKGSKTKLLPYTNFYVEVLTQYWIKLLHVEVLTNVWIKLLHIEVLAIFPDKTSTLTKLIKNHPQPTPTPSTHPTPKST